MRRWWPVAMVITSAVLLMAFTVGYVGYQQKVSDRRYAAQQKEADRRYAAQQKKDADERAATNRLWCELFIAIDPQQTPPTTDRAREVQQRIGRLRDNLRCEAK